MKLRQLFAVALSLVASPVLADDKWEVTTSFEMVGMPFQMPPQTQTVCLPPGQQNNEKMIPADKNCKVASFTTSGNTSRFRIECAPPQQMTGEGEVTRIGTDAYKGTLKAKGNMQGQAFDMKIAYAGRKIGSCPASENVQNKAKAAMAQQQAQVGQACAQLASSMTWQMADTMAATCPTLKADICKVAKAELAKAGNDPDALRNLQERRGDWRELARYCGTDAVAIEGAACTAAKQKRIWGAVAEFCGNEAQSLAAQNCTGRSYTVIMTGEYGPLCERFADQVRVSGGGSAAGTPSGANKLNQAIDGINKLRGLFGK
jgi:hypothetical protein